MSETKEELFSKKLEIFRGLAKLEGEVVAYKRLTERILEDQGDAEKAFEILNKQFQETSKKLKALEVADAKG